MIIDKIISIARRNKYLTLNEKELKFLLSHSKILIEKDTFISDKIRLLKIKDELLLQEKNTENEILVRIVKTKKEAEEFINKRLETYEKMWDGCGCKVDYYK